MGWVEDLLRTRKSWVPSENLINGVWWYRSLFQYLRGRGKRRGEAETGRLSSATKQLKIILHHMRLFQ